uniref:Uncharacterized protein n=1 Tax=Oryza brachyantha TaxID=4533 RepID=J3N7S6_ORYBR
MSLNLHIAEPKLRQLKIEVWDSYIYHQSTYMCTLVFLIEYQLDIYPCSYYEQIGLNLAMFWKPLFAICVSVHYY